jgi:hypothetical protein
MVRAARHLAWRAGAGEKVTATLDATRGDSGKICAVVAALLLILVPLYGPRTHAGAAPAPDRQELARTAPLKALTVLDAHCARCHESGRTGDRAPDRFANILSLDEIAREPRLVAPGQPDASPLYQRMLGRHAPLDAFAAEGEAKGPTPQEIEAVRDWIETLPPDADGPSRRKSGPVAAATGSVSTIDLAIATDKETYTVGDLVTFSVSASLPCHLTLISIDRDGEAVVLFPNDMAPDNLIAAGVSVEVPAAEAGYQLRFDRPGPETVVALCQRTRRRPEGIRIDYEKQRFTILGNWRAFLRTSAEREAEIVRRAERRSRHKGEANGEPGAVDPTGPNVEGRTAITIMVTDRPAP